MGFVDDKKVRTIKMVNLKNGGKSEKIPWFGNILLWVCLKIQQQCCSHHRAYEEGKVSLG
jgi:hypothetical protein